MAHIDCSKCAFESCIFSWHSLCTLQKALGYIDQGVVLQITIQNTFALVRLILFVFYMTSKRTLVQTTHPLGSGDMHEQTCCSLWWCRHTSAKLPLWEEGTSRLKVQTRKAPEGSGEQFTQTRATCNLGYNR